MPGMRSTAFSVEGIRKKLLDNVEVPAQLVTRALKKLEDQLEAKELKIGWYRGEAIDKVVVEDHGTQARAAESILKVADAFAHEGDARKKLPTTKVTFNSVTGIMEIVVGEPEEGGDGEGNVTDEASIGEAPSMGRSPLALPAVQPNIDAVLADFPPEVTVVKLKPGYGKTPPEVLKLLYDDE